MNRNFYKYNNGLVLIELLISIFILTIIIWAVSLFQRDIFSLSFSAQNNLSAQLDARHLLKQFNAELREASQSSLGAYPIALASSSAITFYSDINNDGLKERIRYFLSGSNLNRGVLSPSGSPLVYNSANEKISLVVADIRNSSTSPIFQYYNTNYTGSGSALSQPVDVNSVRMVKMNVVIDKDPNKSPNPISVETKVSIRNLKDNL